MKSNWIYSHPFDYEYKIYKFLAFHQKTEKSIAEQRLYPIKKNLISLYNDVKEVRKLLAKINDDNETINTVIDLVEFSFPKLSNLKIKSESIEDNIEEAISIEPFGLYHNYTKQGVLFVKSTPNYILSYNVNPVYYSSFSVDKVRLNYIQTTYKTLKNTYGEILKKVSIGNFVPNIFEVNIPENQPFYQTVLPITKIKLLKVLNLI